VLIAVAETGLAALLGTALGFGAYFAGRAALDRPRPDGRLPLPTDVLPHAWVLVAAGLGLPLLAALAAAIVLRRVTISPFGVVRRVRRKRAPWPWPGILIVVGVGSFTLLTVLTERDVRLPNWVFPLVLFGGSSLAALGVVLGAGWITYATGRLLRRYARRPAALLAGGRLVADPWSGSRNLAALLACVLFGAGAAGVRAWFLSDQRTQLEGNRLQDLATGQPSFPTEVDPFYAQSLDLVNAAVGVALLIAGAGLVVAVAESIVTNRRAYASLVATGVPRAVLARAVLWQSLAPAVPAILLAVAVGAAIPRGLATKSSSGGYTTDYCVGEACSDPVRAAAYTKKIIVPEVVHNIPIPFEDLAIVGLVGVLAVLATAVVGLRFLRSSTDLEELRAA
jgi:predicted lysophospholipase L1 biosynthesis ABC-type transport system permease subunit